MSAILYLGFGVMIVCGSWIPLFIRSVPLSLSMLAIAAGTLLPAPITTGDPLRSFGAPLEHIIEIILLTSIYGAGLNIDRRFSLKSWGSTWRLLFIVMPISIVLITAGSMLLLGLPLGLALLLAAMLSPTDPVLASNVQVGPPGVGEEGEVRFALTSESGLNDALALPFVGLALLFVGNGIHTPADVGHWLAVEVVWALIAGAGTGAFIGWLVVVANRGLPERLRLGQTNSGIAGIGLSFIVYGVAEQLAANGFVAVFCLAVAVRNTSSSDAYPRQMSHAGKQIERAMMVFLMTLFGYAIMHGLLDGIGWMTALFAVLVLLVARPIPTLLGFVGSPTDGYSRAALAFFGIRGIGTLYYMVHAADHDPSAGDQRLFSAAALTVLISAVLYGATSSYVMSALDRTRQPK